MEDEHIFKSRNKTLLLYHFVFPMKYRRKVLLDEVSGEILQLMCKEISERYEIEFMEKIFIVIISLSF
ncbi:transposase [Chryseobacterium sp. BIGb0232]|uniref:transposase n=1 Tax=Chryseobacterium sp. BIGb0232 TaxID=2940598 RepID=UPI000FB4EE7E|nr:REP element-mobilizing transposase RayT [Chryseobacterium sp. BIGb0232]ROS18040.1 transposase IS200 family protein [Chryseobacterium nakagawai]